jgi:mannose-6-phosphate isomerase-like protein (cupin superfamily)
MKRIICGVGDTGQNSILIDETLQAMGESRDSTSTSTPTQRMFLAWASEPLHVAVDRTDEISAPLDFRLAPGETRFVRVELGPGVQTRVHRTPHVSDYLVALQGTATMVADDGTSATVQPGDMVVQLGGWHQLRNDSTETFVIVGVLVGVQTNESVPGGVELREIAEP